MAIKVGCCGYPVSMGRYQEAFQLVELNSTFYKYPRSSTVERWRRRAPETFEFTVKAHKEISHEYRLKPEMAAEAFERMKNICRTLEARILLIQTPASFKPESLPVAEEFFGSVNREGLTLVWETRGPAWERPEVREKLGETLERLDVPHVTDPLRVMPVYVGEVAYLRLHGLGSRMYYYQYTDEELKTLHERIKRLNPRKRSVYVLFNNLSMFEDGLRFKSLLEDGRLPRLTGSAGLESVRAVVGRTRYPTSKSMLISKVGWRLFEAEDGSQVRLSEVLKKIPSKTYRNPDEVLEEVKRLL